MYKNHQFLIALYFRISDLIVLNLAFILGVYLRFYSQYSAELNLSVPFELEGSNYASLLLFSNITWLFISNSQKVYYPQKFSSRNRYLFAIFWAIILQFLITIAFNGLLKTFYSRLFLLVTYILFSILLILGRWLSYNIYRLKNQKKNKRSSIVIFDTDQKVLELKQELEMHQIGLKQKIIGIDLKKINYEKLEKLNVEHPISELYVPLSNFSEDQVEELTTFCDNHFIRLRLIFDWRKVGTRKLEISSYNQTTLLKVALTPLDDQYNALLKRSFDLLLTVFAFVFLFSWLFPIIALAVKFSSKGPVFFKQKRTGLNNKEFNCYKFRSMRQNSDADSKQATQNDPRITKVGAFLRKSSLDELPQFINVFKGQMSIVGPRPHMLKHTKEYSNMVGNFMNRHAIKPGITGLAQIKGFRGEIDDFFLLQNRVRLDRFYVNNWTLYFDAKIVFLTIFTMFKDHK